MQMLYKLLWKSKRAMAKIFNYGDNIQTYTPISESNFTTLIQPYLTTPLLLQDGGSGTFDKLDLWILPDI